MNFVTYVKEAVTPGGTPTRYLMWVVVVLIAQVLSSVLASEQFYQNTFNLSHVVFFSTILIALGSLAIRKTEHQIIAAYVLYIVGLVLCTITISVGITPVSGIIFMLTWAMTLFVAERREYISFDAVAAFMFLMLIATIIILVFTPQVIGSNPMVVLITGGVITAIDIYIVYTDFGYEKNYYQESRRIYANLEVLSSKISEILSTGDNLEHMLWLVSQECIPLLGLEDCVFYLYDSKKNKLVQVAAYGNKDRGEFNILNPIEINPGQGIVGRCFQRNETILIEETKRYPGYIVDDLDRNSELAVPIISNGKPIGVIDSEHSTKGFFKERHQQAFHIIAAFCGIKITDLLAKDSIQQAEYAKRETEKYKELDELKNRFITNISHDLKTPLTLIKGPAAEISESTEEPKTKKLAEYVKKNAEHLLRVVNQLIQLNRVDKGQNELYIEEINFKTLVSKILAQYEGLIQKENYKIHTDVADVNLFTDSFKLEQIFHNLIHNAFRYSPSGATIGVEVRNTGSEINIEIWDTGEGISQENQQLIFDRFFKVDDNNHEGTGIGLSLVKEYVEKLGGLIRIDSTYTNGAKFIVTLPKDNFANPNEVFESINLMDENGSMPIMLVVEDHPDLNNFICESFEDEFTCISAYDGKEGLAKIQELKPDVIISDLMMPGIDGQSMIEEIKSNEQLAHIPIIVLSAKSQTTDRIDLYDLGIDNYLVKPFDIGELKAIVQKVLKQRQLLKAKFHGSYAVYSTETVQLENEDNDDSSKSNEDPIIEEIVRIVKANLDNSEFSVSSLLDELSIGRNKLQKLIKDRSGFTPVEFIRSIRLAEAKQKLEHSDLNVSEVAYSVGFNNLSYFTRSFKLEFGILPNEIKK